jgi:hypothetical protein
LNASGPAAGIKFRAHVRPPSITAAHLDAGRFGPVNPLPVCLSNVSSGDCAHSRRSAHFCVGGKSSARSLLRRARCPDEGNRAERLNRGARMTSCCPPASLRLQSSKYQDSLCGYGYLRQRRCGPWWAPMMRCLFVGVSQPYQGWLAVRATEESDASRQIVGGEP